MLHPSYSDLMTVVNSEVEPGEQPVVQSRYSIVMATSKRARQIIDERIAEKSGEGKAQESGQTKKEKKPLSVAIEELYTSKVKIVGDDE
ncbi:MAG: DNA-directed RNA polymerase subunit omega [Lachnospiraceae bacterium]|nr:DNA-directed RNA polymerase subunit omega [Lachnospiraceae bacterium]